MSLPRTSLAWPALLLLVALAALVLAPTSAPVQAEDGEATAASEEAVSYYHDIRPIFRANCQGCHQPALGAGEYVMTDFEAMLAGGETGIEAIIPGDAAGSYLMEQITPIGGLAMMPKNKPPLTESEVALIERWISEGATDDTPASARQQFTMDNPPVYQAAPLVTSLDFSPDGSLLAVSGYHEVLLHHADGSGLAGRLVGLSERIESAVFSPDGTLLAVTGGSPGRMGELQIWNVAAQELVLSKSITFDTIYGASWSPDGSKVALGCAGDHSARIIDVATGEEIFFNAAHSDWVLDTTFSRDGSHLLSVGRDRTLKLYVVAEERFIDNVTSITPGALKGGLLAVDSHPNEDHVVVGGADGVPKVYRIFREQARRIGDDFNLIRAFEAMPGRIYDVEFNADGSQFVAGSSDDAGGAVRVYNVADGALVSSLAEEPGPIYAVAFSADGTVIASGGFDGMVRLTNAATGEPIAEFLPVPLQTGGEPAEESADEEP